MGILWFQALPSRPSPFWAIAALALAGLFALRQFRQTRVQRWIALLPFAVAVGFGVSTLEVARLGDHLLRQDVRSATVEARVVRVLWRTDGPRYILDQIQSDDPNLGNLKQVQIKWRGGPEGDQQALDILGQTVEWRLSLLAVGGPVAPGSFDFRHQAYFKGLSAYGYSLGPPVVLSSRTKPLTQKWRLQLRNKFRRHLSEDAAGLATALTVGLRGDLSPQAEDAIRDAGLAHLLAISGLHVGMVVGALFFLIRFLGALLPLVSLRLQTHRVAAALALVGALGYFALSGGSIPTQRATIVAVLTMLAVLLSRRPFSLRSVGLAAILVLLLKPSSLVTASFQMSFAAVTGLIIVFNAVERSQTPDPQPASRLLSYAGGVTLSSLIATVMTSAFALFHFQQLSLLGIVANVIAVPLTALFIMPLLMLATLLAPLGMEAGPLWLADFGLRGLIRAAELTSRLQDGILTTRDWPPLALGLFGLTLWLSALLVRPLVLLALVPLGFASFFAFQHPLPDLIVDRQRQLLAFAPKGPILHLGTRPEGLVLVAGQDFEREQLERFYNRSAQLCSEELCRVGPKILALKSPQLAGHFCQVGLADNLILLSATPSAACQQNQALDLRDFPRTGAVGFRIDTHGDLMPLPQKVVKNPRFWTKLSDL